MLSVLEISPKNGAKNISPNSLIEFKIVDDGSGIDISTLIVEVAGFRAITGVDFSEGFSGPSSVINPVGDDYSVVIESESGFDLDSMIAVRVWVKNLSNIGLAHFYSFKIASSKPFLVRSSPTDSLTIKTPQILYFHFDSLFNQISQDQIKIEINRNVVFSAGIFSERFDGDQSSISADGYGQILKIDPVEPLKNGKYTIKYTVFDDIGNRLSDSFSFNVAYLEQPLLPVFPQTGFLGYYQGVTRVIDIGIGDSLKVEWGTPVTRYYGSDNYILIYENLGRLTIFDGLPRYIVSSDLTEAIISDLASGVTLYYGVRVMETYKDGLNLSGCEELSPGIYFCPQEVEIDGDIEASDLRIKVTDVTGYPSAGYLIIESEVVKYTSIDSDTNEFIIPSGGRGLNNTVAGVYSSGDSVKLFTACKDDNTVIMFGTPTFHGDITSGRELDNIGLVVSDTTEDDLRKFQGFDFCGYHQPLPQHVLQGKDDCGSYIGGENAGLRGMYLFNSMLDREEVLLDQVGEPIILLKRKWSGQICPCSDLRRQHPKIKSCGQCFGTGYLGGYLQFANMRRLDRRLMVKFKESAEDLKLGGHEHLEQAFEPSAWTLPMPAVRDRDLIVRFDSADNVEFIYEVLDVSKEKIMFRQHSRQNLRLKRLDKTDIIYQFPFLFP
jgi:hypothetical protein